MTSDSIKLTFITPEYFDAAVAFGMEHFFKDEPLAASLRLTITECPLYALRIRHWIEQETSVMALDASQENKIVAVLVHRVERRNEKDSFQAPVDEAFKEIEDFLVFASTCYDPWGSCPDEVRQMIDNKFLAVHREYRGRNLSVRLMDFTFDFMRQQQIPLIFVLTSGKYSKAVMEKVGFKEVFQMDYEDYIVDGRQVFQLDTDVHRGFSLLIKAITF